MAMFLSTNRKPFMTRDYFLFSLSHAIGLLFLNSIVVLCSLTNDAVMEPRISCVCAVATRLCH